ncbi:MAG: hypothetical protein ACRCYP_04655 [Alphaproteobacteria bacterium]
MDLMEEVGRISVEAIAEQDKAEAEGKVVAAGKYEGMIVSWNEVDNDKKSDSDPFRGIPVFRVGVRCYDYPEVGKSKVAWVKISGIKVLGENGRPKAPYTAGVALTKAMQMGGQLITDVLEQAKVTRAVYDIATWDKENPEKPEEKIPGGNWLRGVRAL